MLLIVFPRPALKNRRRFEALLFPADYTNDVKVYQPGCLCVSYGQQRFAFKVLWEKNGERYGQASKERQEIG